MRFASLAPHPALRDHVERFWLLRGAREGPGPIESILPDGRPELIFHLGRPFLRHDAGQLPARQAAALIAGQIDAPLRLQHDGEVDVLGVRFTPSGARAFLDLPMSSVTGLTMDLESVWGRAARLLLERLRDAGGGPAAARLLERDLMARLARSREDDPALRFVVGAIAGPDASARPLTSLAAACGMSLRALERRFASGVGIPPVTLARIARFQRALRALARSPRGDWGRLAAECGYYDQPHMNRDFRRFAGMSPSEHARRLHPLAGILAGD